MVAKIFCLDTPQRPTAEQILEHPWLNDDSLPTVDLGDEFKAGIKEWTYRRSTERREDVYLIDGSFTSWSILDMLMFVSTKELSGMKDLAYLAYV